MKKRPYMTFTIDRGSGYRIISFGIQWGAGTILRLEYQDTLRLRVRVIAREILFE